MKIIIIIIIIIIHLFCLTRMCHIIQFGFIAPLTKCMLYYWT